MAPSSSVGAALIPALVAATLLVTGTAEAATPALDTPELQLQALRRIQCSAIDGKPALYYWHGYAYSRVPGEADRTLFRVEGMNIRQCGPLANGKSPSDFRLVSREILLYEDPVTHQVLRQWQNPWTGKTVDVLHVANDPVNGNYGIVGRDGKPASYPFAVSGDRWWLTSTIPLFYTNPLGGPYQPFVGGTYHATEMFNFFGSTTDLGNKRNPSPATQVAWQRMSDWLPWMEMGGRPGLFYVNTAGRKLDNWDQLSETMKAEIERNYPNYREPPPLDDQRPNETSWTYFKKIQDQKTSGDRSADQRKRAH